MDRYPRLFAPTAMLLTLGVVCVLPRAAVAAPKKTDSTAGKVLISGQVRAESFAKQLASAASKPGTVNQAASNLGVRVFATYGFARSPWSLGAAYYGAEPFYANGPCSQVANYQPGGACIRSQQAKMDNTMPGYALNTLGQAYVGYDSRSIQGRIGNQLLNTPFAMPDDSRLKPALFQGISTSFRLGSHFTLNADRITRFESRVSSLFLPQTFITGTRSVPGALYGALSYAPDKHLLATISNYQFYDIASLTYGQAQYTFDEHGGFTPYVAAQAVRETQAGAAYAGIIDNSTLGWRVGSKIGKTMSISVAMDNSPWRSVTVTAPSAAAAEAGYFLPAGGTPVVKANGAGSYTVYYGGIASPYTQQYNTDGLFTSIHTSSMVQRQSAGSAFKASFFIETNNRRLQVTLGEGLFNFSNGAGLERTEAVLADGYYYFGPREGKTFRGFWIRNRFATRTQSNTATFGGVPLLNYNNLYLGYNF